ncbi:MAG: hypothetical protein EXS37_01050 [Opitutus sp.]|nr:hypothetical protein [Opitutus sp.]
MRLPREKKRDERGVFAPLDVADGSEVCAQVLAAVIGGERFPLRHTGKPKKIGAKLRREFRAPRGG